MPRKLMRRIYLRKLIRHALKGERLQKELDDWGCDGWTCSECTGWNMYHNCGVHDSIDKWNSKLLRLYEKFEKYDNSPDSSKVLQGIVSEPIRFKEG